MKNIYKNLWLFLLLFSNIIQARQGHNVFNDTVLHRIELQLALPNWFDTLMTDYRISQQNDSLEQYRRATLTFDGETLYNVGFRMKGNFSYSAILGKKKPFKIKIDEFVDQRLDGVERFDLKNFVNDPSLLHDALSYYQFRINGLVAPRTAYAELYVNGEYWGLYLVVETIDKNFLRLNYGGGINNDGNLYKAERGALDASLRYLGDEAADYEAKGLRLLTNESTSDWSRLLYLIDLINNQAIDSIAPALDSIFAVDDFITLIAIEKLLKAWDNYSGAGVNYYIYEHPDGKIRWLPWDYNETFQTLKRLEFTEWFDGYLIPSEKRQKNHPLLYAILQQPQWRERYLNRVCEVLNYSFNVETIAPLAHRWRALIDDAYRRDPHKINTYHDFRMSLTETNEDALVYGQYALRFKYPGIFEFVRTQREWARDQYEGLGVGCALPAVPPDYSLHIYPNPARNTLNIDPATDSVQVSDLSIFNVWGQRVYHESARYRPELTTLDLGYLPAGLYWIQQRAAGGNIGWAKLLKVE
jgi:CotH kinase protein/Secretion system C-terminal sorting domain